MRLKEKSKIYRRNILMPPFLEFVEVVVLTVNTVVLENSQKFIIILEIKEFDCSVPRSRRVLRVLKNILYQLSGL